MSNIDSLLSCKFASGEDPFSDRDIKWVESILGLKNGFDEHQLKVLQDIDSLDVEACPGSGKTTVLVAKLALLARYWKPNNQGICVLSMTNAAREEIQEKLGNTIEGQKLLYPPHFIGTIHSFFSEFLAKPYLNSNNMSIVSIDDDFCRSQRRKTLQKKPYLELADYLVGEQVKKREDVLKSSKPTTKKHADALAWLDEHNQKSLEEQRLGIPVHWKMVDTDFNVVTDRGKPLDLPEPLLPVLKGAVSEVIKKGIFSFSDIFVYSKALMKSSPDVYKIIRTRFPLLLIDEAQDTSRSQAEMIYELFMSDRSDGVREVVRQRFGDANQTIYTFEVPMPNDGVDPYPSPRIPKLTIPVSHRFDQSIAKIASKFETNPLDIPMRGMRQVNERSANHCVLIFDGETRHNVIPAFAELVKEELDIKTFEDAKIRACSHIQKDKEELATNEDYARTIRDYYSPYVTDKLTKEYQQHSYLIDYVRHGRFLVKETNSIGQGLEKIAEGIFKSSILVSNSISNNYLATPFSKIKSINNKHRAILRSINQNTSFSYIHKALQFLTDDSTINKDMWKKFTGVINDVLCELLSEEKIELGNGHFFSWHAEDEVADIQDGGHLTLHEKGNVYRHQFENSDDFIDIKLGTIHSVKGQTHTATLLLESTYGGPILGQLKSFLIGEEDAKESTGNKRDWLNTLYVGLTRPTHLVCLAIPETHKKDARSKEPITWTEDDFVSLKAIGWKVVRVKSNNQLECV
ncbi:UvrD-helicase domain-containing protein [Vibrio paracholerae]|uniref:UvrD-helicase domain-containing protein n=1 Tax=Vibrio paracholerae TaxID=650003 RepID=UPI001B391329|nr:UvrD-helicase domain-containing protein [Vibrio paracholerae]MBP8548936.1 UvrD-helicase domain-containing protein [Vibrio paracholerae]